MTDTQTTKQTTTEAKLYNEIAQLLIERRDLELKLHDRNYDHLQGDADFWKRNDRLINGKKRAVQNRVKKLKEQGFLFDREKRTAALIAIDPNWNWKWVW
tara:strand:+ start:20512 stop:20811 length:300 start_codon:yes stop_codon:yes gene_type:complete